MELSVIKERFDFVRKEVKKEFMRIFNEVRGMFVNDGVVMDMIILFKG